VNYRKDEEARAILRRELRDNLVACLGCICVGTLIGLFIGLSLRFH
jgi:hypothetical protein